MQTLIAPQVWPNAPLREARQYRLEMASNRYAVREAQTLRFRVFSQEMGAMLPSQRLGLDEDQFDALCDHLLVRHAPTGEVVGTYRLLPYARARQAGGFYSAGEFELAALKPLLPEAVEAGRACVDQAHRNGMVVMLLWSGIAGYVAQHGARYLLGSASVPVGQDPQAVARAIYTLPAHLYLDAKPAITPRNPFPLALLGANPNVAPAGLPPLLQSYLRAGAKLGGQPHWDEDFGTADLLVWLDFEAMDRKYARRFAKHPAHA